MSQILIIIGWQFICDNLTLSKVDIYSLKNLTQSNDLTIRCSALLWHRLMGRHVLSTRFQGTSKIRSYAHCSKHSVKYNLNQDYKKDLHIMKTTFTSFLYQCSTYNYFLHVTRSYIFFILLYSFDTMLPCKFLTEWDYYIIDQPGRQYENQGWRFR